MSGRPLRPAYRRWPARSRPPRIPTASGVSTRIGWTKGLWREGSAEAAALTVNSDGEMLGHAPPASGERAPPQPGIEIGDRPADRSRERCSQGKPRGDGRGERASRAVRCPRRDARVAIDPKAPPVEKKIRDDPASSVPSFDESRTGAPGDEL